MKLIETTKAVGHVLCHDITQIIRGEVKDARFRKGHIVTPEDIPVLLSLGKEHLYVWEKQEGMLHENEGAQILYDLCKNEFMRPSEIKEGKIDIFAERDGLFKVDVERLNRINSLGEMMIATRRQNFPVQKGDKLAGTRIIPLVIEQEKMDRAREVVGEKPLLAILPFQKKKVGVVTTGSEVFRGRIIDTFGPVVMEKFREYGAEIVGQEIVDDKPDGICQAILRFVQAGADIVACTGGMSVDPDDATPGGIRATGAQVVSYGAPVLPGAMFLLAYYGEKRLPIIGLPGCVMYAKRTVFDLVLPRLMADDPVTAQDIAQLGHGGLCLSCDECVFPNCGFGK